LGKSFDPSPSLRLSSTRFLGRSPSKKRILNGNLKNKSVYIELCGPHAAGKTTLLRALSEHIAFSRKKIVILPANDSKLSLLGKLSIIAIYFPSFFSLSWFFARYVIWNKQNFNLFICMLKLYSVSKRVHMDAGSSGADLALFDGMLHILTRIEFRTDNDAAKNYRWFWNKFSKEYDGVIFVDLDHRTFQERMEQRHRAELSVLSRKGLDGQDIIQRMRRQYHLLKGIVLNSVDIPVLILNGADEITLKVSQVVEFVTAAYSREMSHSNYPERKDFPKRRQKS
jgi:deoxyadenosine/deoxycytidine kinase